MQRVAAAARGWADATPDLVHLLSDAWHWSYPVAEIPAEESFAPAKLAPFLTAAFRAHILTAAAAAWPGRPAAHALLRDGYYCQVPGASPGVYRDDVKTTFGTPLAHYPKLPPSPVFWSSRSRVQLLVGQEQVAWLAKSLDAEWSRTPTHPVVAADAEGDIQARVELGLSSTFFRTPS